MKTNLTIHDETEEQMVVATNYSMDEINRVADYAKALHSADLLTSLGGDKVVASVHPAVIHKWCADQGVTYAQFMCDQKLAKRFLEDPDNSQFRIWKGRI